MLRHDQIKQAVEELREAIHACDREEEELKQALTQCMVQKRDLQAAMRLAANLSSASWEEEQSREMQVKAIQEKAAAVMALTNGETPPVAEAACDGDECLVGTLAD